MKLEKRKITELKPHRHQHEVFGDLSDVEFQALKEDIARNGLLQPIEITPRGCIIDGHQRLRVCQELGLEEIEVVVREDLSADEIDLRFIECNLHRRQLDQVGIARALKRLYELRYGEDVVVEQLKEFRAHLARALGGMSDRNVSRYVQLLRMPRAIHDAVSKGLSLTTAIKAETLTEQKQQEIAARIEAGEDAGKVFSEYIAKPAPSPKPLAVEEPEMPTDLYGDLMSFLDDVIDELASNAESLAGQAMAPEAASELLGRALPFFDRMLQLEKQLGEQQKPTLIAGKVAVRRHSDTVSDKSV